MHVAPNACCGTETYHDGEDCCVEENGRKFVKRGQECETAEDEESEVDERMESPEPSFYQYDEEEE
jgi:hypothetical protein